MAQDGESGEKTEEATPRRREESREKGQVAISTELVAALSLGAAVGCVLIVGGPIMQLLGGLVRSSLLELGSLGTAGLDLVSAEGLTGKAGYRGMEALMLFSLPLLGVALVIGYGQVGFHIAPKAIAPKVSKLNPMKGLERMFSARSVVRTLLAILKLVVIAGTIFFTASGQLGKISQMEGLDLGPALAVIGGIIFRALTFGLIAIVAIGLIDMFFQRWQHERDMLMTKQEVKEEHKNIDGDPHIKARIRQVQREMASRRMMAEVPGATVVVTNPTHFAVALKYDRETDDARAPYVVAKGVDHVAQQIKKVAADSHIVCFEDVPLARALHAQCEIGDQIPEDLFEAVAGVLAYVYRVQEEPVHA